MELTHRERIEKAIALKDVDRLPFSLWMHCHNTDRFPRKLAEFTLDIQKDLDLDFIKFMPYGRFSTVEWGANYEASPGFFDEPKLVSPVINCIEDWEKNVVARRGTEGEYAVVLEAQRIVMESLPKEVPLIVTIFSPLTNALWLTKEEILLKHLRTNPSRVTDALEIMMETTIDYVTAAVKGGADGVFFASRMSHVTALSREEHQKYVIDYDVELLNRIKEKTWLNIVHIHGDKTWWEDIVQQYPVPIFNWHDRDDGPSMAEARKILPDKCFWGGMSHLKSIKDGTEEELKLQIEDTWHHNDGRGVILGPGCVVNARTPRERLRFISQYAHQMKRG
ncbi:uroporphyrinogen decarboxylase family protein [Aminobacterium colombiense]